MQSLKCVRKILTKNIFFDVPKICCTTLVDQSSPQINAIIDDEVSKIFFTRKAQHLMSSVSGFDLDKIFRKKSLRVDRKPPQYEFMTTKQLNEAKKELMKKAKQKMQMPPLVPVVKNDVQVIEDSPELIGFDTAKYVFTDIRLGVRNRNRIVVVREPSGVLRKAFSNEVNRVTQIYFPIPGREIKIPSMFRKENLEPLWEKEQFIFILDRACCQFEPDDREFHDVTFETYNKVNEKKAFEILRSTRYFGPLVFYLALTKNLDNLLIDTISTDRMKDAYRIILLYNMIHNNDKQMHEIEDDDIERNFREQREKHVTAIKKFIETEASNKTALLRALKIYLDSIKIKEEQSEAIQNAVAS